MKYAAGIAWALLFGSCSLVLTSCLGLSSGNDWSLIAGKQRGTVELGTVRVDKIADWDSVEAEARRFLPLLLAEQGYFSSDTGTARYRVDAVLIEREYMENWKTRRSLSAEILVWEPGESILPLGAGKAVVSGSAQSLSSSKVLHKLLNAALANALESLSRSSKELRNKEPREKEPEEK